MSDGISARTWVILGALVFVGLAAGGVWYLRSQPPEETAAAVPPITNLTGVSASGESVAGPAKNAFDGNIQTFWEIRSAFPYWIHADYDVDVAVLRYSLTTGNHGLGGSDSTTRMPKAWNLQCAQDGQNWSVIDTRIDQKNWHPDEVRAFSITAPRQCRSFRFTVTEGNHPDILRVYEIGLFSR